VALRRRRTATDGRGFSLAKGPIALVGLAMIAFGVISFIFGGDSFATNPPSGDVTGDTFLGVEGNGWTNLLWVAGGLLLVLGAPAHWGAKTMAIIVGLVLIAAAIISFVDGPGVFGIFAANNLTELLWAAVGVGLLILALLPRVGGKRYERDEAVVAEGDRPRRGRTREAVTEREAYEQGRRDERERTAEKLGFGDSDRMNERRFGKEREPVARDDETDRTRRV
jgi:hypothetical protein